MVLSIALGGGIGAVLRHYAGVMMAAFLGAGFPYGTLVVNVSGSLAIGMLVELMAQKWNVSLEMRAFLVTGILGGYTTFSAFSLDVLKLVETGRGMAAAGYVLASVGLSLAAVFAGVFFIRGVMGNG